MPAKGKMTDPVESAHEDGTFGELLTPLNCGKAKPDPQADLQNEVFPHAEGHGDHYDPMGFLDLTGPRGRRGDPH